MFEKLISDCSLINHHDCISNECNVFISNTNPMKKFIYTHDSFALLLSLYIKEILNYDYFLYSCSICAHLVFSKDNRLKHYCCKDCKNIYSMLKKREHDKRYSNVKYEIKYKSFYQYLRRRKTKIMDSNIDDKITESYINEMHKIINEAKQQKKEVAMHRIQEKEFINWMFSMQTYIDNKYGIYFSKKGGKNG